MSRAGSTVSRSWGLHAVVLASIYTISLASLALSFTDDLEFAIVFGVIWIPLALVHAVVSTIVLAAARPGRRSLVLAHSLALACVALALASYLLGPWLRAPVGPECGGPLDPGTGSCSHVPPIQRIEDPQ